MHFFPPRRGVIDTTLCDKVCQWLATGRWFSPGTQVSSINNTDLHDIKPNHTFFLFSEAEMIIGSKWQPVVAQEADISMADLHRWFFKPLFVFFSVIEREYHMRQNKPCKIKINIRKKSQLPSSCLNLILLRYSLS